MRDRNQKATNKQSQHTQGLVAHGGHGYYITPHGIVGYSFGLDGKGQGYFYLEFVYAGRLRSRRILIYPMRNTINREIRKFVDEVVAES